MFLRKSSSVDTPGAAASVAQTNGSRTPAKAQASLPADSTGGQWSSASPRTQKPRSQEELGDTDNVVVIGEGVSINCEIWNCSRVIVSGTLNGALAATEVIVRETGRLNATVYAQKADIAGLVDGKLVVTNHVDIRNGGCVSGGLVYGTLAMEPGGVLTGNLRQDLNDEEKTVIEGLEQGDLNAPNPTNANGTPQQPTWVKSMGQTT